MGAPLAPLPSVARSLDNLHEVRDTLEIAAAFARGFDFPAAVARAKDAVRMAKTTDARDEAVLRLRDFEAKNLAWRASIESRGQVWHTEELAAADVDTESKAPASSPRETWRKLVRRLRGEVRAAEGAGVIALDNQP